MEEEKVDSQRWTLTEEQKEALQQQVNILQNFYMHIGSTFCDLMESMSTVKSIRKNLEELQEDITKDLGVPRADRLNWNLKTGYVEVADPPKK